MATTKIWDIKGWLGGVLDYAENPEKTANPDYITEVMEAAAEDGIQRGLVDVLDYAAAEHKTDKKLFVSGVNCDPSIARHQMTLVKKQWQKEDGIVAFHAYQSFKPEEVTPQQAHEIGIELANRLWGERFQVVVATHLNTNCIHNHFVLNSVSFIDGKRYYDNKETYRLMRRTSDEICRQRQLSVIENPQSRGMHYAEWQAEQNGQRTWRSAIQDDVDKTIMASMTWSAFMRSLSEQGYEIRTGVKHMAIRPPGKERFVRLRSLGEQYTEEAIRQRILKQSIPQRTPRPTPDRVIYIKVRGDFRLSKITWKGLRALYFYYLRKLRAANKPYERVSYLIREDLRLLDKLSEQNRFLAQHKIDTLEQLAVHRKNAGIEIAKLTEKRKELINEKRRQGISDEQKNMLSSAASSISVQLKSLRKTVRLCYEIEERTLEIIRKNEQMRKQENTHKEEVQKTHEQKSR